MCDLPLPSTAMRGSVMKLASGTLSSVSGTDHARPASREICTSALLPCSSKSWATPAARLIGAHGEVRPPGARQWQHVTGDAPCSGIESRSGLRCTEVYVTRQCPSASTAIRGASTSWVASPATIGFRVTMRPRPAESGSRWSVVPCHDVPIDHLHTPSAPVATSAKLPIAVPVASQTGADPSSTYFTRSRLPGARTVAIHNTCVHSTVPTRGDAHAPSSGKNARWPRCWGHRTAHPCGMTGYVRACREQEPEPTARVFVGSSEPSQCVLCHQPPISGVLALRK
jgi:hypothetical protein